MVSLRPLALGATLVTAALVLAMAAPSALAQERVTVTMNVQSNSGQSGTATLTAEGNRTRVVVSLSNSPAGPQPAHIHPGSCATLDPRPAFPLQHVVNGRSETVVEAPLSELASGKYAINVHRSLQEAQVYVSCGDILAMRPARLPATGDGSTEPMSGPGLGLLAAGLLGAGLALRRRLAG